MIVFARNLVVKDFWLKLFSLALAILIWITVYLSTNGETSNSPLLALIGRPPDQTVLKVPVRLPTGAAQQFSSDPADVKVTLRGAPQDLKALRTQDIQAVVDVTGVESANGLVRPVEIILPKGISYTRLEPETVEVKFFRKTE
jgi:YbbR domain-containing protein